jgi:hypothetical protein
MVTATTAIAIIGAMISRRRLRRAMRLIALGLMVAAVTRELSLPRERRRWEGRLLGIPYSFRLPTPARILRAYWNPSDPRLFTDRVFGVGWSINLARARPLMERGFRKLAGTTPAASLQASPSRSLTKSRGRP